VIEVVNEVVISLCHIFAYGLSPVDVSVPEFTPDRTIFITIAIELCRSPMAGIRVSTSLSVSVELSLAHKARIHADLCVRIPGTYPVMDTKTPLDDITDIDSTMYDGTFKSLMVRERGIEGRWNEVATPTRMRMRGGVSSLRLPSALSQSEVICEATTPLFIAGIHVCRDRMISI
jgi:hypothetical protein